MAASAVATKAEEAQRELDEQARRFRRPIAAAVVAWETLGRPDDIHGLRTRVADATRESLESAWGTGADAAAAQIRDVAARLGASVTPANVALDPGKASLRADTAAADYAKIVAQNAGDAASAQQAVEASEYALDRIAVSESAAIFNEAKRETVRSSLSDVELNDKRVIRRWITAGDPCARCAANDGKEALLYGTYASGEEPGEVHPNCQCSEEFDVIDVEAKLVASSRLLDLGVDDVHVPSVPAKRKTMSELTTPQRKRLKPSQYADPTNKAYPIHDKAHADNAAARLEQQKGSMSPGKYAAIKRRVKAAQNSFGEQPKKPMRMRGRGFRLSIDHPTSGRIEVRHMTEGDSPAGLFALELKDATGDGPKWNQLAKPGRYFKDGSFFELDTKIFSDIVRNFNASENKKVPVDFEHASELRGSDGTIPVLGAPAQGWITSVEMRADGLWGLIEWNDLAKQYIDGKNYRYLSPAIRFGCKDSHSGQPIGARLTSTALTNVPFLDGMKQVAAKDKTMTTETQDLPPADVQLKGGAMCYSANEYMPRLRSALRLSDLATAKMCKEHLGALRDHFDAAGGDHTSSHEGVRLADYMMPMRDLVGAAMGSTWDDVFDVVDDMIDSAMDQHEVEYHSDQQMSDKVEEPTMSDKANEELTVQLKDSQTEVQRLTFALKEADAQLKATHTKTGELGTEIATLKAELDKRDQKAIEDEVDSAILAYKDSKGIAVENKADLIAFLKAAPAVFRKQYPQIAVAQAHLLRDVATGSKGPGANGGETPITIVKSAGDVPDMKALTDKYVKEGKPIEQATALAYIEVRKAIGLRVVA
jgi:hypothetical protein